MAYIYVNNKSTNPFFNLALEEYFLSHYSKPSDVTFMLWQNEPTIVIGRNQNACDEIDETFVQENGIHVVRRNSGGGAVYHDLGNLNFSFIQQMIGDCSFSRFAQPIID